MRPVSHPSPSFQVSHAHSCMIVPTLVLLGAAVGLLAKKDLFLIVERINSQVFGLCCVQFLDTHFHLKTGHGITHLAHGPVFNRYAFSSPPFLSTLNHFSLEKLFSPNTLSFLNAEARLCAPVSVDILCLQTWYVLIHETNCQAPGGHAGPYSYKEKSRPVPLC